MCVDEAMIKYKGRVKKGNKVGLVLLLLLLWVPVHLPGV